MRQLVQYLKEELWEQILEAMVFGGRLLLKERLIVLFEINQKVIDGRGSNHRYWAVVREGLVDASQFNRNMALKILKQNLSRNQDSYSQKIEEMWTIFFDIYDTLESFGSHLVKAVWPRTEMFFEHIREYRDEDEINPLIDFRIWLSVLFERVGSHVNLKARRYV